MGLRTILGLPPKATAPAQPNAAPPPARSVWDKAVVKYKTLVADPRYQSLSDAHKAALDAAWTNANAFAAANRFDEAKAILVPAVIAAANNAVAPEKARLAFDQAKAQAGAILDAAALLGVPSDHVTALRKQCAQVSAQEKVDIIAAAKAMADLTEAIRTDPQLLAAKAARDRVMRERPALDDEITEALKTPPETPSVARALRQLPAVQTEIIRAAGGLKFIEACAHMDRCKQLIAEIKADAAAIVAAVALRDAVLQERVKIDADVETARLVNAFAPEHKELVAAFSAADDGYCAAMRDKDYVRAKFEVGRLGRAAALVVDFQADNDAAWAAPNEDVEAQEVRIFSVWQQCEAVLAATPEMTAAQKAYQELWNKRSSALDKDDFPKALKYGEDMFPAMDAYLQLCQQNADAIRQRAETEQLWTTDLKPRLDVLATVPIGSKMLVDAFSLAHALGKEAADLFDANDYAGFTAKVPALRAALDEFDRLAPLDDKMAKAVKKAAVDFGKIKPRAEAIAQSRVATEDFQAAQDTVAVLVAEVVGGIRRYDPGAADELALLEKAVIAAEGLKAANDSQIDAKIAEVQAILRPGLKRIFEATTLMGDHQPYADKLLKEFKTARDQIEAAFDKGKYDTAREIFELLEVRIGLAAAEVKGWTEAAKRDELAVTARRDALEADLQLVLSFDPLTPEFAALRQGVTAAEDGLRPFLVGQSWAEALVEIGPLEQAVAAMKARQAHYTRMKADHIAMTAADAASRSAVLLALAAEVQQPEVKDIQNRIKTAFETAKRTAAALDFAGARAAWAEVDAQLAAWQGVPPDQTAAPPERAEVVKRDAAIGADCAICIKITPVPKSIKPLVNAFKKALYAFVAAYDAPDWPAALSLIGPLEKAIQDLLPKAQENAAATKAAQPVAAAALATIKKASVDDLKAMPVKARLDLLEQLRGEGIELTKEQRKAQRQIYASLTIDEDFKVLDDARQDQLSAELGKDPELKAAKTGWAAKTVEDRLRILQKVVVAECRTYEIPVPEVRAFSKVGDLGFFTDANGTININVRPGGSFDDFQDAMNTVLHENAHNMQYVLIQRLEEGILKPGDPEFNQALIFAANLGGDGYVRSAQDEEIEADEPIKEAYKNQPAEMHAWDTGDKVSAKTLALLNKP